MTTTMNTIRTTAAACLFTAIVAGTLAPGFASAHLQQRSDYRAHDPHSTFTARKAPDSPHDSIVVTWEEAHYHPFADIRRLFDYRVFVRNAREEQLSPGSCAYFGTQRRPADGCISRIVSLDGPSYSATITGLTPNTSYYVWVLSTWVRGEAHTGSWLDTADRGRRQVITTAPRQTPTTPTPTTPAPHTHSYAATDHSHGTPLHSHGYAPAVHTHRYAAVDHTHAAGTEETAPATSSTTAAAQTCPRFIELDSPWTYKNGTAREHDGSVWVAVHAIEYMMEKTVRATSTYDSTGNRGGDEDADLDGVMVRLMVSHDDQLPRAFILEGANLADVADDVRCQTAPVAVTTEDPPAAQ